uniref:response regulator transcription factor n=1 Tax=Burkholderia anthina TaxID=179879 RepID=UPI001FC81A89
GAYRLRCGLASALNFSQAAVVYGVLSLMALVILPYMKVPAGDMPLYYVYGNAAALVGGLTERETGILRLLRSGCTAHDIARQLCVAVPTVYGYYKRLNEKFSVNHISLTVKRAATLGLLDM